MEVLGVRPRCDMARWWPRFAAVGGTEPPAGGCGVVCMYDYIAVSTRTLTPPTTGTVVLWAVEVHGFSQCYLFR